ncbi:MAG: hypothetical protein CME64_08560 [Halobacteriovoraceae bacterium]|nr:hypothetical protein [Halobacteriovoraceae bacterium]
MKTSLKLLTFSLMLLSVTSCLDELPELANLDYCPGQRQEDGSCPEADTDESNLSSSVSWDFSNSSDYTFDSDFIEISGNKAQIKSVDTQFSGTDFNNGTHLGSDVLNNKLTLLTSPSLDQTHINNILPSKTSSLIGYWRFDGNLNDTSSLGNNGTLNGNTALDTSQTKIGSGSVLINGAAGDSVSFGDIQEIDNATAFTGCVWVYHKSISNDDYIFSKSQSSGAGNQRFLFLRDDVGGHTGRTDTYTIYLRDDSSEARIEGASNIAVQNQWTHVCISFRANSSTGLRLYVNGVEDANSPDSTFGINNLDAGTRPFLIGDTYTQGSALNGYYDELAIFNAQLSSDEIRSIYEAQHGNFSELASSWTPKYDSIVGYWKMNGSWADSSPSASHGSPNGAVSFSSTNMVGTGSGQFNGSSGFLSTGVYPVVGSTPRTVTAWIKTSDDGLKKTIVDWGPSNVGERFNFQVRGNVIRVESQGNGENGTMLIADQAWHFVAVSCTGANINTCKLYVDGKLDKEVSTSNPINTGNTADPLRIGAATSYSAYFVGKLDEVAIWQTALTESEIKAIYEKQKQKQVSSYDSPVIDLGSSQSITNLTPTTDLPFLKEIGLTSESSSDYSSLTADLSTNLFAAWELNESTGNPVESVSSSASAIVGGVAQGNSGILAGSYSFDGTTGYINAGTLGNLGNDIINGFTTCAWVRTGSSVKQSVIGNYDGTTPDSSTFQLQINRGLSNANLKGAVFAYVRDAGGGSYQTLTGVVNADTGISDGKWHHLCANYNVPAQQINIYIDAVPQSVTYENQGSLGATAPFDRDIFIGANNAQGSPNNFFRGSLDSVNIWTTNLSASEVLEHYRRGANRVKYQIRTCSDSSCSGSPEWKGPGGDSSTFFSELYNRSSASLDSIFSTCYVSSQDVCDHSEFSIFGSKETGPLDLLLSDFPVFDESPLQSRYFQYRVIMEAQKNQSCSGEACVPSLNSLNFSPSVYHTGGHSITGTTAVTIDGEIESFSETVSSGCTVKYQFSKDGTNFSYYNSGWTAATDSSSEANTASEISSVLKDFISTGSLYFRAYLVSDGSQACELEEININ